MSNTPADSFHPGNFSTTSDGWLSSLLGKTGAFDGIQLEPLVDRSTIDSPTGAADQGLPEIPESIGRFRILAEVGRGGIGVVYRVHDPDLGRDLALKVLLPRFRGKPEACQRFLEEAQIGGQLQPSGIVPVHEMGVLPGPLPWRPPKNNSSVL